jgi:hypothetical protein
LEHPVLQRGRAAVTMEVDSLRYLRVDVLILVQVHHYALGSLGVGVLGVIKMYGQPFTLTTNWVYIPDGITSNALNWRIAGENMVSS